MFVLGCSEPHRKIASVAVTEHALATACLQASNDACLRACDDGHAPSCVEAGRNAELGLDTIKSGFNATGYYRRACELGSLEGCYNSAYALEVGLNGRKDVGCALALYKSTCEAGHARSCMAAGMIYAVGSALVDQNPEAARASFQRGCDLGYAPACKAIPKTAPKVPTTVAPSASSAQPQASTVPSVAPPD